MSEQLSVSKAEESAEIFSAELTVNHIFNGINNFFAMFIMFVFINLINNNKQNKNLENFLIWTPPNSHSVAKYHSKL